MPWTWYIGGENPENSGPSHLPTGRARYGSSGTTGTKSDRRVVTQRKMTSVVPRVRGAGAGQEEE